MLELCAEMLRSRRTVNFFRPDEPVSADLLLQAIEVARWAPNHRLTEPWHFYILGHETVQRTKDLIVDLKTRGREHPRPGKVRERLDAIPGWFVLTSRLSPDNPLQEREDYAACACAVQNLMLYLWQAGVGVKWTTGDVVRDERFYRLLGIDPEGQRIVGLFWYGYPAIAPGRQKRRRPEAIATWLD